MMKIRTEREISSECEKTWDTSEGMSGGKLCPCEGVLYAARPLSQPWSAQRPKRDKNLAGENGTKLRENSESSEGMRAATAHGEVCGDSPLPPAWRGLPRPLRRESGRAVPTELRARESARERAAGTELGGRGKGRALPGSLPPSPDK